MSQKRKTIFSPRPEKTYRYVLWREWDRLNPNYVLFIGLNPSTADEAKNDNTIRRSISFERAWGFGAVCVVNIFALRATRPAVMKTHSAPVGPRNDYWLRKLSKDARLVVAAWGADGAYLNRQAEVTAKICNLFCLGTTMDGSPRHPLYVKKTALPERFYPQGAADREEMLDAIRGIRRGLASMAAGKGEPARMVLDRIRAKHKIPHTDP